MKVERKYPPKLLLRFFRWYCHPKMQGYIEGDLMEVYERRIREIGKRKADIRFIVDVLLLFRPGIIKSRNTSQKFYHTGMVKNNFKIATRNLWKNKISTVINVFGLTTGITSCLLIALFIRHETSFDKFQHNKERIARVVMEYSLEGSEDKEIGTFTSAKVAPVFSRTFPEVLKGVRMNDGVLIVHLNNEPITESNVLYTDSSFFDVFHYEMLHGTPATALNGPGKIVLTESAARKYFGRVDVLGKILEVGERKLEYEITGIMRDYPATSQIKFDFLVSFSTLRANQERTWFNANFTTYLLLTDKNAFASLQQKLDRFMENETKGTGDFIRFYLEPFEAVHIHSPYSDMVPNTSVRYLYMLGGIAALIIVIVCFTYINLSTAKSIERAREVGIRKVSGAARIQIFWQFIGESFVLCSLSVIISFALAALLLPYFNVLIGKSLPLTDMFTSTFLVSALLTLLMVTLAAGYYPAMVLSKLQPVRVLKGVFKNTQSAKMLQQSLTVFQFAISVFLIIATIVIQSQLHFIQTRKLGYDREHVITLPVGWNTEHNLISTLGNELKSNPHIVSVSRCESSPVYIDGGYGMRLPSMPENETIPTTANPVDAGYVQAAGLQLIAGSGFSEQHIQATYAKKWEDKKFHYILNESAVKKLGFKSNEDAIGQQMILNTQGTIVGVIEDFNFQSLRSGIEPLVLFTASWGNRLLIKVSGNDLAGTLAFLESKWKQFLPNRPFDYRFLDQDYARMYQAELQLGKVMNLFSVTAILLACLGLFGLSSYIVRQRIKEISIRKLLGASLLHILHILSGNFIKLVLLAIAIAVIPAYLLMQQWLDGFVYRIGLNVWIFVSAGLITILIAAITTGIQGIRAGLDNPVNGLRSE